ncbi:hypothetical protein V1517DRAFT_333806 [Lipomyces orientalis]|uniref:Uncharacterized protein n=1 Tax=Lipomyces orientalis TaxID=1233043 RepID=A0ACC3TD64_9ASCO
MECSAFSEEFSCGMDGVCSSELHLPWFYFDQKYVIFAIQNQEECQKLTILIIVLTNQPKELMAQWLDMIPGERICNAAELKSIRTALIQTR